MQVQQDRKVEAGLKRTQHLIICIDGATVNNEAHSLLPRGRQLLPHPTHSLECSRPIEHVHSQMDQKIHSWLLQWWQLHGNAEPYPTVVQGPKRKAFPLLCQPAGLQLTSTHCLIPGGK